MDYSRVSDANEITKKYMDSILIEERIIDSQVASTETDFLGETFSCPVMMPAFSHLKAFGGRELTGLEEYSLAAKNANVLNFCGMMENDMFQKIISTGAMTIRIVKPYDDNGKVRDQMKFAEDAGAFGIGMDIDHIFGETGLDICAGEKMAEQTSDMLRSYIESTVESRVALMFIKHLPWALMLRLSEDRCFLFLRRTARPEWKHILKK